MSPEAYGPGAPRPSRARGASGMLHRLGQAAPFALIIYVIALATLRIEISPHLGADEARLVGAVDLRLIYDGAQPPLFHWLMRLLLEATGWDWALSAAALRGAALGLFYLAIWDAARRLAGPRVALIAVAAATLTPQVVWMSATTTAHATLALALAAAAFNVMIRLFEEPNRRHYLAFGAIAGLGVLTSFSFLAFLAAIVAAAALEPELRYAFRRRALFAAAAFSALTLPLAVGALIGLGGAPAPSDGGLFSAIDPPFIGVDGFLSFVVALVASAAAAAAIWLGARAYDRTFGPLPGALHPFAPVMARAGVIGAGAFAAAVLLFDVHAVPLGALAPLLAPLPVYLAVAWPLRRAAGPLVALALAALVLAPIGFWLTAQYAQHRFATPYASVAAQLARETDGAPTPIVATRQDDAANFVLALGWPGAASPQTVPLESRALLLWRGRGDPPPDLTPEGFAPAAGIKAFVAPLENRSDSEIVYSYQLFERIDPGTVLLGADEPPTAAETTAESAAEPEPAPAAVEEVDAEIEAEPWVETPGAGEPQPDRPPLLEARNLLPFPQGGADE